MAKINKNVCIFIPGPSGVGPRQRPRTIHVDDGADLSESLASSRVGPRGSSSNISGIKNISCLASRMIYWRPIFLGTFSKVDI